MSVDPFEPAGVEWTPVSPRLAVARRAVLGITVLIGLVATVPLAWFAGWQWLWLPAAVLVVLGGWGWWLISRQVRAIAYAERSDDLLVRRGIMWRSIVVVPYGRMQYVDVETGPVAQLLGIATVQLHTASAATDAEIPGLPPEEAARLRDRLASRGQAQLAGL